MSDIPNQTFKCFSFIVHYSAFNVSIHSAQSLAAKAKDSGQLSVNLQTDRQVQVVTKNSNHLLKRTVTSDRVRIG